MSVILVTGANSGFGKEIALQLASEGHTVIASMRDSVKRANIFKGISNIDVQELDVTKSSDRDEVIQYINSKYQKLDVLVNNAGFGFYGALEDASEEEVRKQFEVNFFGASNLIQISLPLLRESRGKIINITSMMGYTSMPLSSVYSASKFALEGLSIGLSYELKPFGVQVCNIQPGRHRTGFVQNINWAKKSLLDDSVYNNQNKNLTSMMEKLSKGKPIPATNVSKQVCRVISIKNMPLQVQVGHDSRFVYLLKKALPTKLFKFITSRLYGKVLQKEL